MSGSGGANLPINIRLTGTADAEAAFNRVGTTAGTAMQRVEQSTGQASGGMRNLGQVVGQAGFQMQDFAVQVQGGTSALTALSQQGSQFLGVFGTAGAVAGAVLTVGILASQLLTMGESATAAEARIKAAFDGIKAESEGVRDLVKEIGDLFKTASERAMELSQAQRAVLANNADLRLSNAIQLQDAATARRPALEAEIALLERRASVEAELARRAGRGGLGAPVDQTTDVTSALFVARAQMSGLLSEMALQSRRIGEINAARTRLEQAGSDQGYGQYGPEAPRAERTRASAESATAGMREYQAIMREAEGQVTRTLSEEEKRNVVLDRLAVLLANGDISSAQYVAGLEAQARAVEAAREQAASALRQRQEAESARLAEREADRRQSEADRFSQNWGDRIALETTRGLFEGTKNGETAAQRFGNAFRNILMSSVSAVLSRNVFQPLVSGSVSAVTGAVPGIGSLLGFGGPMGGAAGISTAGSLQAGLAQGQQSLGLYSAGQYGNLGNAFSGNGLANTGFGWVDGALNTTLWGGGAGNITSVAGAAGDGGALLSHATQAPGMSAAGAIGGAAGIAGGAYSIYSGVQKGGVGGAAQVAGGALSAGMGAAALAGLGSLGPPGWIAAAALLIAGALLPGEKASGRGQMASEQVDTGEVSTAGLGGKRFSAANMDSSKSAVGRMADLARDIGAALGGAQFGSHVAVGTTSSRGDGAGRLYLDVAGQKANFANDEAGTKALAEEAGRFILRRFREVGTVSGDYAGILNASGDSVEALQGNLDWYEKVYKTFGDGAPKVSAYEQSLQALNEQFQPAIDRAGALGLSIARVTEAREKEIGKLREARDAQVRGIDLGFAARLARVRGDGQTADLIGFDAGAETEIKQLREGLESLGLDAVDAGYRITRAEQVLAEERLSIQRDYAARALEEARQASEEAAQAQIASARSVLDWLNSQALGGLSSLSPTARLSEAERQFNAALQSGDARGITFAADGLLGSSREVLGGATTAYAEREAFVRATVGQVGLRAAQGSGNADVVAALSQTVIELKASLARVEAAVLANGREARISGAASLAA